MKKPMKIDLQQFRPLLQMIVGYEKKNGKKLTQSKFVRTAMTTYLQEHYYFRNDGHGTVHIYTRSGGEVDKITEQELLKIWED